MDNIKSILGKLYTSQRKINLIIANSPKLYPSIDNLTLEAYYKTLSKLSIILFTGGNSLAVHQKVPFVIRKATVITQDFVSIQAIDCISGEGESILYFDEYLDDSLFYKNHDWYLLCWTPAIEFPTFMETKSFLQNQVYVEQEQLWVKKK